jgi:hypothetical protein
MALLVKILEEPKHPLLNLISIMPHLKVLKEIKKIKLLQENIFFLNIKKKSKKPTTLIITSNLMKNLSKESKQ